MSAGHGPDSQSDETRSGIYMTDSGSALPPMVLSGPPNVPGYEILSELGRGGMGVVFKARQVKLNRLVALKMVLVAAQANGQELVRFRREAEAVARFQHPNIVQIYEIGEAEGRPYFSLEFVEGGSLAQKLDGNPWPAVAAALLVQALAGAVAAAHEQGIIHRDLKPANVLLTRHGQPKITDFGLAKLIEGGGGLTRTGAVMGTPSYMAPEQASGVTKQIGPPADIYSLGAILYELLTGQPPFQGKSAWDIVTQVLTGDSVPPRQLQPRLPGDLEAVCLKCLHKDPRQRYASGVALAEDLGRFLANEPVVARASSLPARLWRWCRRHAASLILAVAGVVLLTAGISVAFLWAGQERAYRAAAERLAETIRKERLATVAARQEADKARLRARQAGAAALDLVLDDLKDRRPANVPAAEFADYERILRLVQEKKLIELPPVRLHERVIAPALRLTPKLLEQANDAATRRRVAAFHTAKANLILENPDEPWPFRQPHMEALDALDKARQLE
jgi:serine/threonine-protein kinase